MLVTLLPAGSAFAVADTTEPEFHSVEIDRNGATAGERINIAVDASDAESGIGSVEVIYQYSRTQDAQSFELLYNPETNKYEASMLVNSQSFGLNGLWRIAYILLTDSSGNKLQVFNGTSYPMRHKTIAEDLNHANLQIQGNDVTPPVYHDLWVDKTDVVAGDQVKVKLIATDLGSGVDYATVSYTNTSTQNTSEDVLLQYNPETEFFEAVIDIENEFVGGRWIVHQLSIYDKNLNVIYLSNSETQKFDRDAVNFHDADFIVKDNEAPVVTGVENHGVYNTDVYPVFNEGTATLNNNSFKSGTAVTEEGSYWLYVRDSVGNTTYVSFDIDKTAPLIMGIEPNSIVREARPEYEYGARATLNGEEFQRGTVISREGHYTFAVTDKAGNKTVITFEIDRTGPVVTGFEDGRAYNTDITPEFEGTATLNETPFESGTVVTEEGNYVLVAADQAGNQTFMVFSIDKTGPTIYGQTPGESIWPMGEYANMDFAIIFLEGTATLNGKEIVNGHIVTEEGLYTVIAKDDLGNETTITFTLDKTGPEIKGVTNGYFNTDLAPTFTEGTATLNGNPYKSGTVITQEGEYLLEVTDSVSNSTYVNFFIDKTAPIAPAVQEITEHSTVIKSAPVTGDLMESAVVTVKSGDKVIAKTENYLTGSYQLTIPKQKSGTKLTITATDVAGNISKTTQIIVKDVTPPAIKVENKVTHHSTRVIGTAEAASTITVKAGSKSIGTATADAKGNYQVVIAKQKVGTKLAVTATDAAGNSSAPIAITVVDGNYPDLKVTHWALEEIMYLGDDQIIGGYPNGNFDPEKYTKRAEAAKMLVIALDLPVPSVSSAYKDVSNKHWAKDYIAAATKAGLFNGNPDGTFAPDKTLKRSEMAKIISVAYDFKAGGTNHFKDVKSGYWASGYISGLYENGITTGYSDKTFRAEKSTTRAEFSVFLARALNKDFR